MDSLSKRLEELKKIVLSTDENLEERSGGKKSEGVEDVRSEGGEKEDD